MKVISSSQRLLRGNIYRSIDIAASGMTAYRKRMDSIASNIANESVTNVDGNGNPYLRRYVEMRPEGRQTFAVTLRKAAISLKRTRNGHVSAPNRIVAREEETPLVNGEVIDIPNMRKNAVYDPSHPDADVDGFVVYPDINIMEEMVELMIAGRSFDANVTVVNAAKQMISSSLEI